MKKVLEIQMIYCCKCKIQKSELDFDKNRTTKTGRQNMCRVCKKNYDLEWNRRHPEVSRLKSARWYQKHLKKARKQRRLQRVKYPIYYKAYHYKKYYGISLEQLYALFKKQNNRCAICRIAFDPSNSRTNGHVDHNHVTKKVRGLLCNNCNKGLGQFGDSLKLLKLAVNYLERTDRGA